MLMIMESLRPKIQFIADLYFRICDFSNFCCDAHQYSGCQKRDCKYEKFSNRLYKYLKRTDRTEDEKRNFLYSSLYDC